MLEGKTKTDSSTNEDRKVLTAEIKRLQKHVQLLRTKNQCQREKVLQHQQHELALMQTNRMLIDMVNAYADREAVIMANWKTLQQTFGSTTEPDVVDLDDE